MSSMTAPSYDVFASYSHQDARFIRPMIQYLRPTGATVFRDQDAIAPGQKWAAVITEVIRACRVMYLFWCSHSARSPEVQGEYELALGCEKAIVPVLLDSTPLPDSLSQYQWVDLRPIVGPHEEVAEKTLIPPAAAPRKGLRWPWDRRAPAPERSPEPGTPRTTLPGAASTPASPPTAGAAEGAMHGREIPDDVLRRAAALLSAHIDARVQAG